MRCVCVTDYHRRIFVFLYEIATIWETTLLIFPQLLGASPLDPTGTPPLDPAGGLPSPRLPGLPPPTLAV